VGVIDQSILQSTNVRLMLEISDIDDTWNDPDVTVTTYRGKDPLAFDSEKQTIPWTTNRVDEVMGKRFIHKLNGRIVNGKIITDPADVILPWGTQRDSSNDEVMRDFRIELQLGDKGAVGIVGAYVNVERWWLYFAKTWGAGLIADITGFSAPATYRALKRYADAYPNSSGENEWISTAYHTEFSPVFIVKGAEPH